MKKILTGAHLKWIATITMLLDHIGAIVISEQLWQQGINPFYSSFDEPLVLLYWVLRTIGRLAFTLYAFLLVEGYLHTRNKTRYGVLLFLFFIISEIPFDLALHNVQIEFTSQNIFLTLFLGFVMMRLIDYFYQRDKWTQILFIFFFGAINEFLGADYGMYGIVMIGLFFITRNDNVLRFLSISVIGLLQRTAGLSAFLIEMYNGERGKQPKYFFYLFYPLHLLILYWFVM